MNIEDLKQAEKQSREKHEKEMQSIAITYAKANQKFEVGQIIDDGISRIKIDSVKVRGWSFGSPPCCVYFGKEYTKKNEPYKSGRSTSISQERNIKVIKCDNQ